MWPGAHGIEYARQASKEREVKDRYKRANEHGTAEKDGNP